MTIQCSDIIQCLKKKQRIRASSRRGTIMSDHARIAIPEEGVAEVVITALTYNASLHDLKVIDCSSGKELPDIKVKLYGIHRSDFNVKAENALLSDSLNLHNMLSKPLCELVTADKLSPFIKGIDGRNSTHCLVAIAGEFSKPANYCAVLEYVENTPSEMAIGKISPDDKTM